VTCFLSGERSITIAPETGSSPVGHRQTVTSEQILVKSGLYLPDRLQKLKLSATGSLAETDIVAIKP
jgi:hypothetical protein